MRSDSFTTPPLVLILCKALLHVRFFKDVLMGSYDLLETLSPSSFLEMIKNVQVDYIILDERSMDNDIEAYVKEIKSITKDRYVPILLITKNLKKSYESQLQSIGIDGVIREPLDKKEIIQSLQAQDKKTKIQNKVKNLASQITSFNSSASLELKHRLALNNKAHEELKRVLKEKQTISLLMIELNQYQQIIFQNGEDVGPNIITAVEKLIELQRRPQDVLISLGGGKWILILPKTSKTVAMHLAEDIQKVIEVGNYPVHDDHIKLTTSIGLTEQQFTSESESDSMQQLNRSIRLATGYAIMARQSGNHIVTE